MSAISNHDYAGYEVLGNVFNTFAAASFTPGCRIVATSGQVADNHDPQWGTRAE
jgi:hypothetical protein